jgi:hypothetical protein
VILEYPTVERLFEKVTVLALELDPEERLLPPEKVEVGVEAFVLFTVQVLVPAGVHPVGKVVPVPKFWVYRLVTWENDISDDMLIIRIIANLTNNETLNF